MGTPGDDTFPSDMGDQSFALLDQPIAALPIDQPSSLPAASDEYDPWIDALEEEENRQRAGDESLPDWYLEAVNQSGLPLPTLDSTNILPEPVTDNAAQADQFLSDNFADFGTSDLSGDLAVMSGGEALPAWLGRSKTRIPIRSRRSRHSRSAQALQARHPSMRLCLRSKVTSPIGCARSHRRLPTPAA